MGIPTPHLWRGFGAKMTRGMIVAAFWSGFCTIVWMSMAFLVAYPQEIVNFHFSDLPKSFFGHHGMERIFIPLLVLVDISIDWVLGHRRLSEKAGLSCIFAAVFYVIVTGVIPFYSTNLTNNSLSWLLLFTLLLLFVPRFASFFRAPVFVQIGDGRDI